MASWIESHTDLRIHPKTERLMRILHISRVQAVGHLHLLWWWCWDYAPDGDLSRWQDVDLAIAADWDGEPEVFIASLRDAGFLDVDDERRCIHDWDKLSGKQRKRLDANAARMREVRAGADDEPPNGRAAHVQRTSSARTTHVPVNRTGQNRTEQDLTPSELTAGAPVARARAKRSGLETDRASPQGKASNPGEPSTLEVDVRERLAYQLQPISNALDDDQPASSVTRVQNVLKAHQIEYDWRVEHAVKEALHLTKARRTDQRQAPLERPMPWFLDTFETCLTRTCEAVAV